MGLGGLGLGFGVMMDEGECGWMEVRVHIRSSRQPSSQPHFSAPSLPAALEPPKINPPLITNTSNKPPL